MVREAVENWGEKRLSASSSACAQCRCRSQEAPTSLVCDEQLVGFVQLYRTSALFSMLGSCCARLQCITPDGSGCSVVSRYHP